MTGMRAATSQPVAATSQPVAATSQPVAATSQPVAKTRGPRSWWAPRRSWPQDRLVLKLQRERDEARWQRRQIRTFEAPIQCPTCGRFS
jgi:hypothetical protein